MQPNAAEQCRGRWRAILTHFGISETHLHDRHGPCPLCGGRDRFRFDDKDGKGTWICSHCGAGDGFSLLMKFHGWSFLACRDQVLPYAMSIRPVEARVRRDDAALQRLREGLWNSGVPISPGDPAHLYLKSRKLSPNSEELRFVEKCKWQEKGEPAQWLPAMVARVTNPDGTMATLHRTYLDGKGGKANIREPRKLLPGRLHPGAAIRLYPMDGRLGLTEGIETGMAAHLRFGVPVWAVISAGRLIQFAIPHDVSDLIILGDNDESFTGQSSAYNLAYRVMTQQHVSVRPRVRVVIPTTPGWDWNDDWMRT